MGDPVGRRLRERERLIALASSYVDRLSSRIAVDAAAVGGSVARGDFNVWSDVDVVILSEDLPERPLDRSALLLADAPPGVQAVGYTRAELERELRRANRLVCEAVDSGVPIAGGRILSRLAARADGEQDG